MSTARDKNVLGMILNPLMPGPLFEDDSQCAPEPKLNLPNIEQCEQLDIEGVKLAESLNYEEALSKFNEAITICPSNPSPYNNRAQVYRLQGKNDEALDDLEKSIALSEGKGKSALQAYNQRALIHRLQGENDKAKEDYEKAASLGSKFAKMQLVALNPYAAMCNAMLTEVMAKTANNNELKRCS
uniref:Tetratricopeptide repeat protein 36 n=1 Tax=Ditylenchus dipsaci TaxID=166011 RepID=A0A915E0G1_9BILA